MVLKIPVAAVDVAQLAAEVAGDERDRVVEVDDPVVRDARIGVIGALGHVVGAPGSRRHELGGDDDLRGPDDTALLPHPLPGRASRDDEVGTAGEPRRVGRRELQVDVEIQEDLELGRELRFDLDSYPEHRPVVVRSRTRRHEDPPLHELVISKLGLPEGEVLGHGEQARFALRRRHRIGRHGPPPRLTPSVPPAPDRIRRRAAPARTPGSAGRSCAGSRRSRRRWRRPAPTRAPAPRR